MFTNVITLSFIFTDSVKSNKISKSKKNPKFCENIFFGCFFFFFLDCFSLSARIREGGGYIYSYDAVFHLKKQDVL